MQPFFFLFFLNYLVFLSCHSGLIKHLHLTVQIFSGNDFFCLKMYVLIAFCYQHSMFFLIASGPLFFLYINNVVRSAEMLLR